MEKEFVDYNGMKVIAGWPEKIEAAQSLRTYSIGGKLFPRVPYGEESEDWGAESHCPSASIRRSVCVGAASSICVG
jgi:hypothetical protein